MENKPEQEFYKIFNIPMERTIFKKTDFRKDGIRLKRKIAELEVKGIEYQIKPKKYCEYNVALEYPIKVPKKRTITPEIVLALEEIILNKFGCFDYMKSPEFEKVYQIRIAKGGLNGAFYSTFYYDQGKTRQVALLNLCTQLKDEIQDLVRAVFND